MRHAELNGFGSAALGAVFSCPWCTEGEVVYSAVVSEYYTLGRIGVRAYCCNQACRIYCCDYDTGVIGVDGNFYVPSGLRWIVAPLAQG